MHEQIIGKSPAIQHVRELIDRVSKTGLNVVITGESGVGKELNAQHLYLNSPRNENRLCIQGTKSVSPLLSDGFVTPHYLLFCITFMKKNQICSCA